MYKALITDMDGTAVRNGLWKHEEVASDITAKTRDAVAGALRSGFKIACATGRGWPLAAPTVRHLGLKSACIIDGGTRIIDPVTEETLWEKTLSETDVTAALEIFRRQLPGCEALFADETNHKKSLVVEETERLPEGVRIMIFLTNSREPQEIREVINTINAQGFASAHAVHSWRPGFLDIHVTHRDATKEHGLAAWHKLENITKDETIAVGDSDNDIPLFQSAGLKIAVADAMPELLALADYIAPRQQDEALLHVIEKFLL